jgi:hypothetical protein
MNISKTAFAAVLLLAAILSGCQCEQEGPFELQGHIFVFNYRMAYASYMLTLRRTAKIPDGMRFVAQFQNPAGGAPVTVERDIFPAQEKLSIESPHVRCVRKDRPYSASVEIFDRDNRLVQKVETTVTSTLDDTVLPEHPLVSGPAYEPNEKARDSSGRIILRNSEGCQDRG